jgi:hypothetical protein
MHSRQDIFRQTCRGDFFRGDFLEGRADRLGGRDIMMQFRAGTDEFQH